MCNKVDYDLFLKTKQRYRENRKQEKKILSNHIPYCCKPTSKFSSHFENLLVQIIHRLAMGCKYENYHISLLVGRLGTVDDNASYNRKTGFRKMLIQM